MKEGESEKQKRTKTGRKNKFILTLLRIGAIIGLYKWNARRSVAVYNSEQLRYYDSLFKGRDNHGSAEYIIVHD